MFTFQKLYQDTLRFIDLASETDTPPVDLVKAAINAANSRRATEDKWPFMISRPFTLSVEAGVQEYILFQDDIDKLNLMYSTTNKRFAKSTPVREVANLTNQVQFNDDQASDNIYFELFPNASPVAYQPSEPSTVEVSSDDVSDEDEVGLYLEGVNEDGESVNEIVLASGTSSTTFARITYVAKTGVFAGLCTLDVTGGGTLLSLNADQNGKQYTTLRFINVPTVNETFTYRYFRKPRVLSRDFDIPDLPFPTSYILVYDALLDLATYSELDSESVNIWRDKQQEYLNNLYLNKLEGDVVAGVSRHIN